MFFITLFFSSRFNKFWKIFIEGEISSESFIFIVEIFRKKFVKNTLFLILILLVNILSKYFSNSLVLMRTLEKSLFTVFHKVGKKVIHFTNSYPYVNSRRKLNELTLWKFLPSFQFQFSFLTESNGFLELFYSILAY